MAAGSSPIDEFVEKGGIGTVTLRLTLKSEIRMDKNEKSKKIVVLLHFKDTTKREHEIIGKRSEIIGKRILDVADDELGNDYPGMGIGLCYEIGQIKIVPHLDNVANFSGTRNENMLRLAESSLVNQVANPGIVGKSYNFTRISGIISGEIKDGLSKKDGKEKDDTKKRDFADVIGVITDADAGDDDKYPATPDSGGKAHIYLKDENGSIRVTLWEEEAMKAEKLMEPSRVPVVIALKLARVQTYDGKKNLSVPWSSPIRVVLPEDDDLPRAHELRAWANSPRKPVMSNESSAMSKLSL